MPRDGGEVLVMKYMTVKDAARRWNVTERLVQRLCAEGRIDGAVKFGRSWSIPVSARKPDDLRRADSAPQAAMPRPRRVPGSHANLMPLMNTPFAPGTCAEFVDSLAPGPRRDGSPLGMGVIGWWAARHWGWWAARHWGRVQLAHSRLTTSSVDSCRANAAYFWAFFNVSMYASASSCE